MLGQEFGHFRVVERIGAGGMGRVLAQDQHLDRAVALKSCPRHYPLTQLHVGGFGKRRWRSRA